MFYLVWPQNMFLNCNDHRKSLHLITAGLANFTAFCGNKMENILMFNLNSNFQVCVKTEILQGYKILFIKYPFHLFCGLP